MAIHRFQMSDDQTEILISQVIKDKVKPLLSLKKEEIELLLGIWDRYNKEILMPVYPKEFFYN